MSKDRKRYRQRDTHGEIDTEITVVIRETVIRETDTGIAHGETQRQTHGYTRRERHR